MCLTEGDRARSFGSQWLHQAMVVLPQELVPTEHIVALLIAEYDKLLGCRFEAGSYFSRFWPPLGARK
jgi:hypothetical protein